MYDVTVSVNCLRKLDLPFSLQLSSDEKYGAYMELTLQLAATQGLTPAARYTPARSSLGQAKCTLMLSLPDDDVGAILGRRGNHLAQIQQVQANFGIHHEQNERNGGHHEHANRKRKTILLAYVYCCSKVYMLQLWANARTPAFVSFCRVQRWGSESRNGVRWTPSHGKGRWPLMARSPPFNWHLQWFRRRCHKTGHEIIPRRNGLRSRTLVWRSTRPTETWRSDTSDLAWRIMIRRCSHVASHERLKSWSTVASLAMLIQKSAHTALVYLVAPRFGRTKMSKPHDKQQSFCLLPSHSVYFLLLAQQNFVLTQVVIRGLHIGRTFLCNDKEKLSIYREVQKAQFYRRSTDQSWRLRYAVRL